ncbi:MAG: hypothetical protein ABS43_03555 [Bordetella sp. SCN 67-23]|nr:DUF1833 family protein [Burkholderiales bacterium]ODS75878.1 MAG: hypothetical protein ABS43_03555 [Bordetella sp. SCN 67-23]OJW91754.1 MAG: hypothetical protein BGO71_21585 [Burkholderiales bacterium 67-32]
MARPKSTRFTENALALAADEVPIFLLEISHALAEAPLRFVADAQDIVSNGQNYVSCGFSIKLPSDQDRTTPRAQLAIDTLGGDISAFLERTHGGRGAVLTLRQILRSVPDFIEDDITLDMRNVVVASPTVTADLGYDDVLNQPGTPYTFRPETAAGLF